MPTGKKHWLRPISELKGGQEEEGFLNSTPTLPTSSPQVPLPSPAQATQPAQPTQATQATQPAQAAPIKPPIPQGQPAPQQPQDFEGGNMDFLSIAINTLNTNPYFTGMLMLLLNLGGRFLSMELSPKQEEFLQQRWLRPLIFFTVIFVATRNLAVAFWMTLALFIILWVLANEMSPFCIVPSWRVGIKPEQTQELYEKNMNIIQSIHEANTIKH